MELPAYIRYFATTDNSTVGALALELCKSMLKIAPVRLATMTTVLVDEWLKYAKLTVTPMVGSYVNVVATDPSKWTWLAKVPMPERDAWADGPVNGNGNAMGDVEYATERQSLYTAGVRNVLYAVVPPRTQPELKVAHKFDVILVPNEENRKWWLTYGEGRETTILGYPMLDSIVRDAICGA